MSKVQLIGLAWLENYICSYLSIPFTVEPAFYRVTLEDKDYACETITAIQTACIVMARARKF
jgi:hypothetical protein